MNEDLKETQELWEETHPWLSRLTDSGDDEEDSVGEVIRYTLDELRLA